jgi:spore coat polysaccharide biosynthesis predicted glycosyltransferase SpsG
MLKWEYDITFVCNTIPDYIASQITIDGFKLFPIENESEFFQIISNRDIIVLDGYNFDLSYQKAVKKLCFKLVCIDDLHEQKFVADLIINHAPGVSELDYKATLSTRFALGLDYALLRPVFLSQALIRREIQQISTVLICFGGADEINLTQQIVSDVLPLNQFKEIIVITGTAYMHLNELKKVINGSEIISHIHQANESEMLSSMLKADIAIVPASGILVEVLAVGCIALSGYYINNQMNIYNGYKKLDAIVDAGDFKNCDISSILANTSNLKQKHIIDGKSGIRIVEKLRLLENEDTDTSR